MHNCHLVVVVVAFVASSSSSFHFILFISFSHRCCTRPGTLLVPSLYCTSSVPQHRSLLARTLDVRLIRSGPHHRPRPLFSRTSSFPSSAPLIILSIDPMAVYHHPSIPHASHTQSALSPSSPPDSFCRRASMTIVREKHILLANGLRNVVQVRNTLGSMVGRVGRVGMRQGARQVVLCFALLYLPRKGVRERSEGKRTDLYTHWKSRKRMQRERFSFDVHVLVLVVWWVLGYVLHE